MVEPIGACELTIGSGIQQGGEIMKTGATYFLSLVTIVSIGGSSTFSQSDRAKGANNPELSRGGSFPFVDQTYGQSARVPAFDIQSQGHRLSSVSAPGILRRVPQDYSTIQAAIDAAIDGDTVLVSENTYYENIRYRGKAIIVGSLYVIDGDTSHIARTIIDGSSSTQPDSGSVVYFVNGEDTTSVLCGFTIQGGTGTLGTFNGNGGLVWYRSGGGVFSFGAGARITHNIIKRNRVVAQVAYGAGVHFENRNSSLRNAILEGNSITDNYLESATSSGYWGAGAGGVLAGADVWVVGNIFERDTVAGNVGAEGGGLAIWALDIGARLPSGYIAGNVFRPNIVKAMQTGADGGGLLLMPMADVLVQNTLFEGNSATSGSSGWCSGAGMCVDDQNITLHIRKMIVNNQFLRNTIVWANGTGEGGGLMLNRTLTTVSGNIFRSNSSSGVNALGGGLMLAHITDEGTLVQKNQFIDNQVQGQSLVEGGGVFLGDGQAIVSANEIVRNMATGGNGRGGGIAVYTSAARLENNIIRGNSSVASGGGLIVDGAPSNGTEQLIVNNTFVDNHTAGTGGALDIQGAPNLLALNNIFWNDTAVGGGEISRSGSIGGVYNCIVKGGYAGTGNIDQDPVFVPTDTLYNLQASSPCIGRGKDSIQVAGVWYYAPSCDYDGDSRPMPVGPQSRDIGAQEEQVTTDVRDGQPAMPTQFALAQNYPNPFNPSTTIRYGLPHASRVSLKVYNTLGQEVATLVNEMKPVGVHTLQFDAGSLASGVYFYRIQAGNYIDTKKLILLR